MWTRKSHFPVAFVMLLRFFSLVRASYLLNNHVVTIILVALCVFFHVLPDSQEIMVEQKHALVAAALTATTVAAACHLLSRHYNLQTAFLQGPSSTNSKALLHLASLSFGGSSIGHQAAVDSKADVQQAVCWDYAQSLEELLIEVRVPGYTTEQDVTVQISQQHLLVAVQQVPVIDAPLAGQVLPQCSSWQLEGKGSSRVLSITLCKAPPLGSEERYVMWASLLLGQDDSRELQDQQRAL